MPTATLEEYLETIYKLSGDGPVRPSRIADAIGVSGPTVTATLKRLEARGLIERDGTDVVLTDEGKLRSLEIVRKHRIAERFLVDLLGLDWDAAHEEACALEHALSPRVLDALERVLGAPTECPHGHPIPSASGVLPERSGRSLASHRAGDRVRIVSVPESGTVLPYLAEMGLRPGAVLDVVSHEPFGGPLMVEVDGGMRAIAPDVAQLIVVEEA